MDTQPEKINIFEKLALFSDHWNPRIIAALNGQHIKLVKFQGTFPFHQHDLEDEMFLVFSGRARIDFEDNSVWLEAGECLVVPRGRTHRTHAEQEASVMVFEPISTINTGNVQNELTRSKLSWI